MILVRRAILPLIVARTKGQKQNLFGKNLLPLLLLERHPVLVRKKILKRKQSREKKKVSKRKHLLLQKRNLVLQGIRIITNNLGKNRKVFNTHVIFTLHCII